MMKINKWKLILTTKLSNFDTSNNNKMEGTIAPINKIISVTSFKVQNIIVIDLSITTVGIN